jgi:hypothetical protein
VFDYDIDVLFIIQASDGHAKTGLVHVI